MIRSLLVAWLLADESAPPEVVVENPYGDMGIHFTDTATQVQRVPLGKARKVVIECYCPFTEVKYFGARDEITLRISGTYSISGYHGSREDAGAVPIPRGGLNLEIEETGDVLRLISREFRYLHHKMFLQTVTVRAPEGVEIVFEKWSREQVEERKF